MTKVQEKEESEEDQHKAHYNHALTALAFIRDQMKILPIENIPAEKFVDLPVSVHKRVLILDMDETLIHCVDDIESESPDIVLEIDFPEESETVCAGINLRPYLLLFLLEVS